MKKTVVLGATNNPGRAAYDAVRRLLRQGHEVVPVGIRKGEVEGLEICNDNPAVEEVHTVTLYLSPANQIPYYSYILEILRPRRLIFNPGTENAELARMARANGIEVEMACTLVMLALESY